MTRRSSAGRGPAQGLAELADIYRGAVESGADSAYRKRRWGRAAEFASWLEQRALAGLEPGQALALYRASGGRESQAFSGVPIEELRDSLDFLLYDTIKLEARFDECVSPEGAYKLPGAGREFVSWLLCVRDPALLGIWNANAERLLRRVGAYHESMKRGPLGIRYLDMMEGLNLVRAQLGLPDFVEVDLVAHLSARPGGNRRAPTESKDTEHKNALA